MIKELLLSGILLTNVGAIKPMYNYSGVNNIPITMTNSGYNTMKNYFSLAMLNNGWSNDSGVFTSGSEHSVDLLQISLQTNWYSQRTTLGLGENTKFYIQEMYQLNTTLLNSIASNEFGYNFVFNYDIEIKLNNEIITTIQRRFNKDITTDSEEYKIQHITFDKLDLASDLENAYPNGFSLEQGIQNQEFNIKNVNLVITKISKPTEVVDLNSLLFTILTLPFTFYSQAFNLTLFSGTAYAINIGDIIMFIISILLLVAIIKMIMSIKG